MKEQLLSLSHIRALSNPQRLEILRVLRLSGSCTVGEIAERLGAKELNLYYHLRALVKAGVLEVKEMRSTATKPEGVYSVSSHFLVAEPDLDDPEVLEALCENVEAILRVVGREHRSACEGLRGRSRDSVYIRRATVRVSPETYQQFQGKLREAHEWLLSQDGAGDAYSITSLSLPILP